MRRKLACRHQMGGFQRGNSISFAQQNWSKKWLRHKHFFSAIVLHRNHFPSYWHPLPMWYNTGKQNADANQAHGLTSACIFRFLRKEPCRQQQIVRPSTTAPYTNMRLKSDSISGLNRAKMRSRPWWAASPSASSAFFITIYSRKSKSTFNRILVLKMLTRRLVRFFALCQVLFWYYLRKFLILLKKKVPLCHKNVA